MPTTYAIIQGNKYMDATLYTGSNASQTVVNGAAFYPDLTWVKDRSNANNNLLVDSVRGANGSVMRTLFSNSTGAEQTANTDTDLQYGLIQSINSNGFTANTGAVNAGATNYLGHTYVGWQWKAGAGSNVTNTSGTITSTVSANTTAGFSIVTFTGNTSNATVGHGLGVSPSMLIVKSRTTAGNAWIVWQSSFVTAGGTDYIVLSGSDPKNSAGPLNLWANTAPTSSVFSVGTQGSTNGVSGAGYVAYCWAAVPGFSAFGSYTGNGSTDGPFVYTGFRPRWWMVKNTTTSAGWLMYDSARNTYNVEDLFLAANSSGAETTFATLDFLSNGFKIRATDNSSNTNGNLYIYAAFAENPFKYANAR